MATGNQKFVRLFDHNEIHLTACAVTKKLSIDNFLRLIKLNAGYYEEPNQFWKRDPNHERALLKIYQNHKEWMRYFENPLIAQTFKITMPFLGQSSSNGWGELQFLIKAPASVKLARHRCFDTRINRWIEEVKPIQPKTDLGTHSYLSLRFYHQDYLPPVPGGDWHFEPVYISIRSSDYYKIDVWWKEEGITITVTALDKDSPEIPNHLK